MGLAALLVHSSVAAQLCRSSAAPLTSQFGVGRGVQPGPRVGTNWCLTLIRSLLVTVNPMRAPPTVRRQLLPTNLAPGSPLRMLSTAAHYKGYLDPAPSYRENQPALSPSRTRSWLYTTPANGMAGQRGGGTTGTAALPPCCARAAPPAPPPSPLESAGVR